MAWIGTIFSCYHPISVENHYFLPSLLFKITNTFAEKIFILKLEVSFGNIFYHIHTDSWLSLVSDYLLASLLFIG